MERTTFDTPVTKVNIMTYDAFRITEVKVTLENSALVSVIVYNQNDEFDNFIEKIEIKDDIYYNWGTDDTYISNYVKNYLQEKYTNTYA